MKIGRNAPCPCGSGKKYKKCCMMKKTTESLTHSILMRTSNEVIPILLEYAGQRYHEAITEELWQEFSEGIGEEAPLGESAYTTMFFRWMVFLCEADVILDELTQADDHPDVDEAMPFSIGSAFLQRRGKYLNSLQRRYIEAALQEPLTFWQIEEIVSGTQIQVRDLLFDRVCVITDQSAAESMNPWDIFLGNTMALDGVIALNIAGPFALPAYCKAAITEELETIIDALEELSDLFAFDYELIEFYAAMVSKLFNPVLPEIQNMDGSELIFTTSSYRFDPDLREEILAELTEVDQFERDKDSGPCTATFLWFAAPDEQSPLAKVFKGQLEVGEKILEAETSSTERDGRLRHMLTELLGDRMIHVQTSSKPLEKVLGERELSSPEEPSGDFHLDVLPSEVLKQLEVHVDKMHMNWADQEVPALDGQTPRQAVKTSEGRRKVIDLLNEWENTNARTEDVNSFAFDIDKLRRELGVLEE
ncbi:SEC-C metal-binding domain-containing protein [Desulfoluna sp.]|uniref:SEC-C metal-binding domain-containing protein n=1 Tax=Desulfoluna sp. TaxID=2045199 RepID=UPI002632D8AA|nr:SEC-C metal-binding domain-containing protein [Desulfoluna sp.]